MGWKANYNGVDLNLQYPADWDEARRIKYAQDYDRPGFTVEAGRGENPLPLAQLPELQRRCFPLMTAALGEEAVEQFHLDFCPAAGFNIV